MCASTPQWERTRTEAPLSFQPWSPMLTMAFWVSRNKCWLCPVSNNPKNVWVFSFPQCICTDTHLPVPLVKTRRKHVTAHSSGSFSRAADLILLCILSVQRLSSLKTGQGDTVTILFCFFNFLYLLMFWELKKILLTWKDCPYQI